MDYTNILQDLEGWKNLLKSSNVYIGGTCALLYALEFEDYLKGQEIGDYVSLFFIVKSSGKDKKELAVFGKEAIENVGSLPIKYYNCSEQKVTVPAITSYLSKWNETLISAGETITLILQFTEKNTKQLTFTNIKVIDASNIDYAVQSVNSIAKCIKYHYRKLQIIRSIVNGQDPKNISFLDYINMISAAWHNVSSTYVYSSLNKSEEKKLSLTDWCTSYNVPLKCLSNLKPLDKFVCYDNKLSSVKVEGPDNQTYEETQFNVLTSTSEIEALQAMKRLLSYLQGEEADPVLIKSAKILEDHFETEAMSKIDKLFA